MTTSLLWLTHLVTCAVASGLFLVGPACKKEHASKLCKSEGMKLAVVDRASLAEIDEIMVIWGASGIWAGHKTEGVAVYSGNGHLNKCNVSGGKLLVLCQGSCHGGHCKRSRAPKSSKRVAKQMLRKGIKEAKPGFECCYSHSDSWASTHVSQEIKTRVPVRRHRHVYKSSSSSCTSSSSCPSCSESTSVTTEEVVRPHKRTYYKKNVKVKDEVCPKEVRQEIRKKSRPACHEEHCPPKEQSSCSGSGSYSEPSSSHQHMRSSSRRRLYKRSFGDDEPELKRKLKALHDPSRRFNKPGKARADGRDRAIRFPSSHSSSSSSSSSSSMELKYKVKKGKEGDIPYVKVEGKVRKVDVIDHNENIGATTTTNDTSKITDKTEESPAPADSTPEQPTEAKPESKSEGKLESSKEFKGRVRKTRQPDTKKTKKTKEIKPKTSKIQKREHGVKKKHSAKSMRRSQRSSSVSCQSEDVKVIIKRTKSKKHHHHRCSNSSCSGSHRHHHRCSKSSCSGSHRHHHRHGHKHHHKHEEKHHCQHHHHKRSHKHGSSDKASCHKCNRYKSKTARKTRVTPISISSGSKHPAPLVLRKKHVRVK